MDARLKSEMSTLRGWPTAGWRVARIGKSYIDLRHDNFIGAIRFTPEEVILEPEDRTQ